MGAHFIPTVIKRGGYAAYDNALGHIEWCYQNARKGEEYEKHKNREAVAADCRKFSRRAIWLALAITLFGAWAVYAKDLLLAAMLGLLVCACGAVALAVYPPISSRLRKRIAWVLDDDGNHRTPEEAAVLEDQLIIYAVKLLELGRWLDRLITLWNEARGGNLCQDEDRLAQEYNFLFDLRTEMEKRLSIISAVLSPPKEDAHWKPFGFTQLPWDDAEALRQRLNQAASRTSDDAVPHSLILELEGLECAICKVNKAERYRIAAGTPERTPSAKKIAEADEDALVAMENAEQGHDMCPDSERKYRKQLRSRSA